MHSQPDGTVGAKHHYHSSVREQALLEDKDVLIVEDDPVFRTMLSGFLSSQGCHVREAENGLEGLKALRDGMPDILLCDLAMPVLNRDGVC